MDIFPIDDEDIFFMRNIINKIDNLSVDYIDSESDKIYKNQPFLLSLILGYRLDLKPNELDEIIKIIFMIWEYFKNKVNKAINEEQFETVHRNTAYFYKYLEEENVEIEKSNLIENDINSIKSKSLLAALLYRFRSQKTLIEMNEETRGILIIGMKSLIFCFEENIGR
jgi:hypothetical protein